MRSAIDSLTIISIRWWYHRHILTAESSKGCHQLTMKETATFSNGHCPHIFHIVHVTVHWTSDSRPHSVPFLLRTSGLSQQSWLGKSDSKSGALEDSLGRLLACFPFSFVALALWLCDPCSRKGYHSLASDALTRCKIFGHQESKLESPWPHFQSDRQELAENFFLSNH